METYVFDAGGDLPAGQYLVTIDDSHQGRIAWRADPSARWGPPVRAFTHLSHPTESQEQQA